METGHIQIKVTFRIEVMITLASEHQEECLKAFVHQTQLSIFIELPKKDTDE